MRDRNKILKLTYLVEIGIWFAEWIINILYTKYVFFRAILDADYAGDAVFAKHLADSGHYIFSKDWYPTTELYIIHHQLIMVPLFKIFDDYVIVWLITSAIAFILMSLGIFYFMRCFGSSIGKAMLAVILFLNPLTGVNVQFSVHFHGYLFYYILAFVILGTLFKNYEKETLELREIILVAIVSFLAGICGIRMFMIVFAPLVVAVCVCNFSKNIRSLVNPFYKLVCISLVGAFAGFVTYFEGLSRIFGRGGAIEGIYFNTPEEIKNNVLNMPQMILEGLSINFDSTPIGMSALVIFVTAIFWGWIFLYTGIIPIKERVVGKMKLAITVIWSSVLIALVFMVLTIGGRVFAWNYRFFSLSLLFHIPIFVLMLDFDFEKLRIRDLLLAIVITVSIVSMLPLAVIKKDEASNSNDMDWRKGYIGFLEENGYTFGISSYWNANLTIMESNGKIQIAPVKNDENYTFYEWNTRKSFKDMEPEFVLLLNDEYISREEDCTDDILYQDEYVTILKYCQ